MDLSKYNNYEVLDAMLAVAELDFQKVCRTNLSTWWGAIFDKLDKKDYAIVEYTGSTTAIHQIRRMMQGQRAHHRVKT
jgi:hypothetical protein